MPPGTRWWFRIEVVLTALKTESLLIAGFQSRMKISLVDASRFVECLIGHEISFTESLIVMLRDCRPEILRQHPEFAAVPDVVYREFDTWIATQRGTYGHWVDFHTRS